MPADGDDRLLLDVAGMERALESARTVAVLGIKPESRRELDAHQIPLYLQQVGYTVLPVPVRYPEADRILGVPVYRRISDVPTPIDILNVFCKPADFDRYVADAIRLGPQVVWFQSGLLDPSAAVTLRRAGVVVAEDCIGCRRATLSPSWAPLAGQSRTPPCR